MRLLALAFVLGTWLLQQSAVLPEAGAAGLGVAALLALRWVTHPLKRGIVFIVAGGLLGYGLAAWRAETRLADVLPPGLEGRDIEVTGVVTGLPQPGEKGTRFVMDVEASIAAPSRIALTWFAERGKPGQAGSDPPRLTPGQRWRLTVRLKRPRGLGNPHGFAFEPWALERGLRATGYVRPKPAAVRLDERVEGWPWSLDRWRSEIRESMQAALSGQRYGGVLVALAIGDQDAIAGEDWEVYWRTGVGHLMSISGLHITMLGGLAFAVVAFAWVRIPSLALRLPARMAGAVAAVLAAFAYALVAGFAVPAQRTCLMLATIAAFVLARRHGSASNALAVSALVVLLFDPWAVLASGFWLSFGAVAAIFYVLTLRTGTLGRMRGATLEQAAVTLVMLPLLVALFQQVSLAAPLANAIAIPVVSLVIVPLALAGAFLGFEAPLAAAHALLAALMGPLEALAAMPVVLESHAPAPWTVAVALAGCAWLMAPRGFPLRTLGVLWLVPLFAVAPAAPRPGEAWADVIDVGHGLAVVVRTAAHALVYDTGPTWNADADAGSRIVVPHLRGEGIRQLDTLVVSHADDDHAGGAVSVARLRAPEALLSTLPAGDGLHERVGVSRLCEAGQGWHWDGVRFDVVHPPPAAASEVPRSENDRSCAIRIATRFASLLLAGDVEARGEAEMIAASGIRSDVLLVPHHGSKTSSTPAFLDAVAPSLAVVSLGHRNRYRHPHPGVLERYRERGIPVRRTDAEGALRVVLPGDEGPRIAGLAPRRRYWTGR